MNVAMFSVVFAVSSSDAQVRACNMLRTGEMTLPRFPWLRQTNAAASVTD